MKMQCRRLLLQAREKERKINNKNLNKKKEQKAKQQLWYPGRRGKQRNIKNSTPKTKEKNAAPNQEEGRKDEPQRQATR